MPRGRPLGALNENLVPSSLSGLVPGLGRLGGHACEWVYPIHTKTNYRMEKNVFLYICNALHDRINDSQMFIFHVVLYFLDGTQEFILQKRTTWPEKNILRIYFLPGMGLHDSRTNVCRVKKCHEIGHVQLQNVSWKVAWNLSWIFLGTFELRFLRKEEQQNFTRNFTAFSIATSTRGFRIKFHGSTSACPAEVSWPEKIVWDWDAAFLGNRSKTRQFQKVVRRGCKTCLGVAEQKSSESVLHWCTPECTRVTPLVAPYFGTG